MKQLFTKKSRMAILAALCLFGNLSMASAADLSLDDAVDMAINHNFKVKIAEKGEEKAKVKLDGAKRAQGPSITIGSSLGISDVNDRGFSRSNSNSIRLSMPLYTGGRNEMNIAKAEDSVTVSSLALAREKENLVMETVTAYYNVLEAKKVAEVDAETVSNYQAHLSHVKNLYAAGSSPKVDLLRSEVELVNAEQTLIKSRNAYEIAVSTLRNIIRLDAKEEVNLLEDAKYTAFERELDSCISYARENRKDLESARVAVLQAEKDVEIAKSDKKPSVSLSVGNSWDKQILPSNDNHSLTASVAANWNVFDNNVTESSIKSAKIAVEEANLSLMQEMDAVDLEVRQNYLSMREAEKRFHTTEVAVAKAQEDYFIANEKYKAGEGTMLDIIDAQLALTTAKTNYIKAQYDYVIYQAKLENAIGISEGKSDER